MNKKIFLSIFFGIFPLFGVEMPKELRTTLDQHREELRQFAKEKTKLSNNSLFFPKKLGLTLGQGVTRFDWLPGYYVKYHINRANGANILKECIKNENLNVLAVPNKYLYPLYDETVPPHDKNCLVIAEKIEKNENQTLDASHINQLITLHKKTGFYDMHPGNLLISNDNKCYIIDTGGAFWNPWRNYIISSWFIDWFEEPYYLYSLHRNKTTSEAESVIGEALQKKKSRETIFYRTATTATTAIVGGLWYWWKQGSIANTK